MELVDLAYYLDFSRLKRDDPLELSIEAAQNYYDLLSRLKGGNISDRIGIRRKRAIAVAGRPIVASEHLDRYRGDRKGTAEALTRELEREYLACIEEIREERRVPTPRSAS
jgi:hypothetical protein